MIKEGFFISGAVALMALVLQYFTTRKEIKNEFKYKNFEEKINDLKEIEQIKNDFNDLDDSQQSEWLLKQLQERREKATKN